MRTLGEKKAKRAAPATGIPKRTSDCAESHSILREGRCERFERDRSERDLYPITQVAKRHGPNGNDQAGDDRSALRSCRSVPQTDRANDKSHRDRGQRSGGEHQSAAEASR